MTSKTWLTRVGIALLGSTAAIGGLAAPAQAASAGTVHVDLIMKFQAAAGQVNRVQVTAIDKFAVEISDRVPIKAGQGCSPIEGSKTRVRCENVQYRMSIKLGDRNDSFVNNSDRSAYVYAGSGHDTLNGGDKAHDYLWGQGGNDRINGYGGRDSISGGDGNDVIYAGAGNDLILDGAGNDRVYGGADNDRFRDGPGKDRFYGNSGNDTLNAGGSTHADRFYGGTGVDTADYGSRTKAVTLDADGKADDGVKGEKDLIGTDVENLTGGSGNDRITGDKGANVLNGGNGNDVVLGLGGNDTLHGGRGKDQLNGGAGNDTLIGDPAVTAKTKAYADVLLGGPDFDTADYGAYELGVTADLDGAKGDDGVKGEKDTIGADVEGIAGGNGSDILTGNNGRNVLNGGPEGADILKGLGGDDTLYSGTGDDQGDIVDAGTHVTADGCTWDHEDTVIGCEFFWD